MKKGEFEIVLRFGNSLKFHSSLSVTKARRELKFYTAMRKISIKDALANYDTLEQSTLKRGDNMPPKEIGIDLGLVRLPNVDCNAFLVKNNPEVQNERNT